MLTVRASATINGTQVTAGPNTAYITGTEIPNTAITDQLVSLYDGATPHLLTGIAMRESSYRQFAQSVLYGYSGDWPLESYDGGSHIGLMMVPLTNADAWDWLENTVDGANLFKQKLALAQHYENLIIASHPGLPELGGVDLEKMAVLLYGPGARRSLLKQYFIPVHPVQKSSPGSSWTWAVNSGGNPTGVKYTDNVFADIQ